MNYAQRIQPKIEALQDGDVKQILAIETSCDETAAAIVDTTLHVKSNVIFSQIDTHSLYGGVVPEIASRMHIEALPYVVKQALQEANTTLDDIHAVAVTYGPGLVGALLTGLCYGKAIAYAKSLPLLGVNHMQGHIFANHITHRSLKPPYLCLVVSGGHSHLVMIEKNMEMKLIGQTQDDAAGEAFDKVARMLSLGYPGGPVLEACAKHGNASAYSFTRPKLKNTTDFSFSGLKTAVVNILHNAQQKGLPVQKEDIAASFQAHAIDFLLYGVEQALQKTHAKQLAICGGVSANFALRQEAEKRCKAWGVDLYVPDKILTTDNAAMIGAAATYLLQRKEFSGLDLNANPSLPIV